MNIVHLSAIDTAGGAALAAHRTHRALMDAGVNSQMVVQDRRSQDPQVHAPGTALGRILGRYGNVRIERSLIKLYPHRDPAAFHSQWVPTNVVQRVRMLEPDLVHLHWICNGFVRVEALPRFGAPLVWTLHDMWPLTGGCHYSGDCRGFEARCGQCPLLGSHSAWDLSRWVWLRKRRAWSKLNLTLVSPSRWLAAEARRSSLFRDLRVEIIPHGIDLQRYRPMARSAARSALGLPVTPLLILFGAVAAAHDHRKGFDLLQLALQKLRGTLPPDTRLVVFGSDGPQSHRDLGMKTHYMGTIRDETTLAQLYAAANVFVLPSRQDNLPNTAVEALACGTPCVAFDVGGVRELIAPEQTGWLARPFDTDELARGVVWTVAREREAELAAASRRKAELEFGAPLHARRTLELYGSLLSTTKREES